MFPGVVMAIGGIGDAGGGGISIGGFKPSRFLAATCPNNCAIASSVACSRVPSHTSCKGGCLNSLCFMYSVRLPASAFHAVAIISLQFGLQKVHKFAMTSQQAKCVQETTLVLT